MERKPVFELTFSYANKLAEPLSVFQGRESPHHFVNGFEITSSYANISVE